MSKTLFVVDLGDRGGEEPKNKASDEAAASVLRRRRGAATCQQQGCFQYVHTDAAAAHNGKHVQRAHSECTNIDKANQLSFKIKT